MRFAKPSLSGQVLLGLVLGIATGVFFGEAAASVQIVGDAFIRLLQMTVIPYIAVSLIRALGGLDYAAARDLAVKGGAVLLLTWAVALLFVVAFPFSLPETVSATFFSTSLAAEREPFDFLALYIPSNPVFSMSHDVVPALVLFSIALGVALIGVPGKEGLLRSLQVLDDALMAITGFVARLAPIDLVRTMRNDQKSATTTRAAPERVHSPTISSLPALGIVPPSPARPGPLERAVPGPMPPLSRGELVELRRARRA